MSLTVLKVLSKKICELRPRYTIILIQAGAAALGARLRRGSGTGPGGLTGVAGHRGADGDLVVAPEHRKTNV